MMVIANVFPKLQTLKNLVKQLSKKRRLEHALTVNMLKCPKYFKNFCESLFKMCFNNFERNCLGECLPYCHLKSYMCFLTH